MQPWFVIPAAGFATAILGLLVGGVALGIALGLAGAAITGALRALMGDTPAALAAAVVAALVMATGLVDGGLLDLRATLAVAAMAWTIAELARVALPGSTPVVAMLPAVIAALLDASFVALIPIAGARLVTAPWQRPRWVVAIPIVGVLALIVAALAVASRAGTLGHLGDAWTGRRTHAIDLGGFASRLGDALGPVVAVAAIAGCAAIVNRGRYVQAALVASLVGTLLVDHRAGEIGASTIAMAAVFAGLAIGRLAGMIRLPAGQAIIAATVGVMLVVPPVWSTMERTSVTGSR